MTPPIHPTDSDITTGSADSILAGMWRQIKKDYSIDDSRTEDLVHKYSNSVDVATPEQRAQIRGNLRPELNKTSMTWKTFVRGLNVLRAETVDIVLILHHVTLISTHGFNVALKEKEEGERNQLSVFLHSILNDLGINGLKFDMLMTAYMLRARMPTTIANKTHLRGNLKKELLGKDLTWRSLIKAFNFLCVTRMEFQIHLKLKGMPASSHVRTIVLNDLEDFTSDKETLENLI